MGGMETPNKQSTAKLVLVLERVCSWSEQGIRMPIEAQDELSRQARDAINENRIGENVVAALASALNATPKNSDYRYMVVITPSDLEEGERPLEEGPFLTVEDAQEFIDSEVGNPANAEIRDVNLSIVSPLIETLVARNFLTFKAPNSWEVAGHETMNVQLFKEGDGSFRIACEGDFIARFPADAERDALVSFLASTYESKTSYASSILDGAIA